MIKLFCHWYENRLQIDLQNHQELSELLYHLLISLFPQFPCFPDLCSPLFYHSWSFYLFKARVPLFSLYEIALLIVLTTLTALSKTLESDIPNLFFLDLAFLEVNLNLLLQHGHRTSSFCNESINIPQTEHGLCPIAKRNLPDGFFAAYL